MNCPACKNKLVKYVCQNCRNYNEAILAQREYNKLFADSPPDGCLPFFFFEFYFHKRQREYYCTIEQAFRYAYNLTKEKFPDFK